MPASATKTASEQKMRRAIEALKNDFSKVRTGRAHTGILEHVQVDYYGSKAPLSQVANLTLIDSHTIGVQPWEKPMVAIVEKAIRESDLGLNPATQGDLIRVPMPSLTEERRRDLVKVIKNEAEVSKVAVRNLRRDANEQFKKLVKDKKMSEDEDRRAQDEIQKLTDKFIDEIDALTKTKESEIMKV